VQKNHFSVNDSIQVEFCYASSDASVTLFSANLVIGCGSTFVEQKHRSALAHTQLQSWNVPRRSAEQTRQHAPARQLRFFPCMSSRTILFSASVPILLALSLGGCIQSSTRLRCGSEILISEDLEPNPCRTRKVLSVTLFSSIRTKVCASSIIIGS